MSFDPNKVTFFARTDARGKNVTFGIKAKDRQRHVYVIGKTGMGKSTMLENMAIQDIQNGEGMAFIDPHGSAAEKLLNYIPENRINDVLYFAPFDTGYPVSFNIMEDVGPDRRHLVVSGLMSVFEKIWVDAWSARMAYILQNTLMALLEYPDSTLLGVNRMLSDKEYRKKVVENVKDPGVKAFWVDEFAKYNERYMQEAGDAIKNKIGQFTANPIIRNIIGQPKSSFDIRKIMDEKKIIIMNLSKGLIGETNANLLGSMLTTRVYLAAMSRADLSPFEMDKTPNFYFYVDEFQSFANATFANILSEARKYRLNLTIAHQYIEQMEEEVRNAVFGNVGSIISFRVGPFDAETLETIFSPQFLATDIVNLGFAQIYLTLMIDGIGSTPFSATTLPPIEPPTMSCKDMVIAASRRQFSHPRSDVEEQIHKFHEPVIPIKHAPLQEKNSVERRFVHTEKESRETNASHVQQHRAESSAPTMPLRGEVAKSERAIAKTNTNVMRSNGQERREEQKIHSERHEEKQRLEQGGTPREHHPKKAHLGDLRSVLKNIVQTEKTNNVQKADPRASEKEEKFKESRGELRNLLQDALKTQAHTAPTPASHPTLETKPDITPVPMMRVPEIERKEPPLEPPQSASQQPYQDDGAKHSITPRELERMMRVGTNDKPPL